MWEKTQKVENQVWTKRFAMADWYQKKIVSCMMNLSCVKTQKVENSSMNKKLAMADSYQNLPRRNSRKLNLAWTRKIAMAD